MRRVVVVGADCVDAMADQMTDQRAKLEGGVDLAECPRPVGRCECGVCVVCGLPKHYLVHARAWGHLFKKKG